MQVCMCVCVSVPLSLSLSCRSLDRKDQSRTQGLQSAVRRVDAGSYLERDLYQIRRPVHCCERTQSLWKQEAQRHPVLVRGFGQVISSWSQP